MKTRIATLTALATIAFYSTRANAAGLLIAEGGLGGQLEIKEHKVNVTINNGIAVTRVEQVFHNKEQRQVEALYTFPVPRGASVADFSMWINGKEMTGEVLEKKKAREIYNSYKATRKDPGLLEQADYRTFEMRIFPINADADQKVQITYYQELDFDHDQARYIYPLATATKPGADTRITGSFSFNLDVKSAVPITAMTSPSHGKDMLVAEHGPAYRQASFEIKAGDLAKDVVVAYSTERPMTGIDVVTQKDGDDGYFLMTVTAGKELEANNAGMDYVFVLDVSGSMADDRKLELSRNAALAFIGALGSNDQFEVIAFNIQPDLLFKSLRAATPEAQKDVRAFLESKQALGGTILNPAITTAYKYRTTDRQLNVVILSDGMTEPTERQTLLQLIKERPANTRVFCICVGNDVNKPLLEQMAQDSGGLAAFVSHGDDFQRQAQAFRRKLTRPAIANLSVKIEGVDSYDVDPAVLPNLYFGAPVRIYGRYRSGGNANVSVSGDVLGKPTSQTIALDFAKSSTDNPEIERMWAWHRIDQLLKASDRTGSREQVVPEVIRLGEGYSIVTEYTSFLVLENDAEFARWKIERKNAKRIERDHAAQQRVRDQLEALRNKAVAGLGPEAAAASQPAAAVPASTPVQTVASRNMPSASTPAPARTSSSGGDWNIGIGSGPVGPLGVLFVVLLSQLKRRK